MRKGRCSNDPKNCTLALNKVELPYAGVDSVCPECGSPLAAIASAKPSNTAPVTPVATTIPTPSPAPPPVPPPPVPPPPVSPPAVEPYRNNRAYDEDLSPRMRHADPYEVSGPPRDSAMKFTQIAILLTALAVIGFFGWRMFLQPRPVEDAGILPNGVGTQQSDNQVTQISPPQMRRVNVVAEVRDVAGGGGNVVGTLPAGSLVDVTGQLQAAGANWLRVTLPNDSSKSGFVREDQLANMGEAGLTISPMDGSLIPPVVPGSVPVGTEAVGPIQPMSPAVFYIASRQANIRQDANATSARIDTIPFSTPVKVVAQRTVGARVWYQIELESGVGWISGSLLSRTLAEAPIDAAPKAAPTAPDGNPTIGAGANVDKPSSQIGEADNQEAMRAFGPGTTIRVDVTNANLRKEPAATGNSVVETLPRDTLLSVEDVRVVNGVPWYRVTSPGRAQGWVSGRTVVEN